MTIIYVTGNTVHSKEIGDEIKRKYEHPSTKLKQGPIDAITMINRSGSARQKSWEAQLQEAVEGETDEFWKQVCIAN